jgi:hypothetical protein
MGVAALRLIGGLACLVLGAILAIASGSLYAVAGLVVGVLVGASFFRVAAGSGRVRRTPGVTWLDQWRANAVGPAGAASAAGIGIGTFLAATFSVLAPHSEQVLGTVLPGLVAGFLLSLRFSRYGKNRIAI